MIRKGDGMQSLLPIKKCIELSGFRVFDIVSGQFFIRRVCSRIMFFILFIIGMS